MVNWWVRSRRLFWIFLKSLLWRHVAILLEKNWPKTTKIQIFGFDYLFVKEKKYINNFTFIPHRFHHIMVLPVSNSLVSSYFD